MFSGKTPLSPSSVVTVPIRLVITVVLIFASLSAPSGVAAQDSNEYEAELHDWTISVSGPNYVLQNVSLEEYPHGRGERIYVTSVESAGFVEISFFDDEDSPEQTIELNLRDFESASRSLEVLDRGFANDVHHALARFELEQGMSGYFYIEVAEDIDGNVDLAQSIYTLDADFLDQLDIARTEISLAGLAFLADPAIDLESIITEDRALLASTPVPAATPDQGSYTFETNDAELVVGGEIEFNYPLVNRELDIMFLSSTHGYGVVGFYHQDADSAEAVMSSVFVDAPTGDEAPVELFAESDDARAFGVYRVETQGESRAMIIEVTAVSDGLWQVQAIAVTESEFASELAHYQSGVGFAGEPMLGGIVGDDIVFVLNDND